MRISGLFFILFMMLPAAADVFFIPGWRPGFSGRDGCVRILKDVYPGKVIQVKSWDSLQDWQTAKINAEKQTVQLLQEIIAMPDAQRRELILVGHSIGAKIVIDILHELTLKKLQIHSMALLGGAVPDDYPRIETALQAITGNCCIIYNPDDLVLKLLFPLDNMSGVPLGLNGWPGKNHKVFEARAHSDRSGFFNHFAYIYLEELDRLTDTLPPGIPEIVVLQDDNNEERVPADQIFWLTVGSCQNWKLQKNTFSGKHRIIDPGNIRKASGSKEKMIKAFEYIRKQLQNAPPPSASPHP